MSSLAPSLDTNTQHYCQTVWSQLYKCTGSNRWLTQNYYTHSKYTNGKTLRKARKTSRFCHFVIRKIFTFLVVSLCFWSFPLQFCNLFISQYLMNSFFSFSNFSHLLHLNNLAFIIFLLKIWHTFPTAKGLHPKWQNDSFSADTLTLEHSIQLLYVFRCSKVLSTCLCSFFNNCFVSGRYIIRNVCLTFWEN